MQLVFETPPTTKELEEEVAVAWARTFGDEPTENARQFASTQVNFTGALREHLLALAARIPEGDLAEYGREDEPHVTVKYGLMDQTPDGPAALLAAAGPGRLSFGPISIFPANEEQTKRGGAQFDVVKVDVYSADLGRLHELLSWLPNQDSFPVYRPHVTLAYVKPGLGRKYEGPSGLEGRELGFSEVVFSPAEGPRATLRLGAPLANKFSSDKQRRWYFANRSQLSAKRKGGPQGAPPSNARKADDLRELLPLNPYGKPGGVQPLGQIIVEAYRVGALEDRAGRGGVFFAGDAESVKTYASLHEGHQVQGYEVSLKNALLAGHQNDVTKEFFGKTYGQLQDVMSRRYGSKGAHVASAAFDKKILTEAKKRGYDGIIYVNPAPPARTEVVLIGKVGTRLTKRDDVPTENKFSSDKQRKWYFANRSKIEAKKAARKATGGAKGGAPSPLPAATRLDYSKVRLKINDIAQQKVVEFFGRELSHDEWAALGCASEEGELVVRGARHGPYLFTAFSGKTHIADRTIKRLEDENGQTRLVLENQGLKAKETGTGLGTKLLANQVAQAAALGVSHIETYAAGQGNMKDGPAGKHNGYATWPRLGYNAPINEGMRKRILHGMEGPLAEFYAKAETLHDLFRMPGGLEAWKTRGSGADMAFDLAEGSRSRRILDAYVEAKFGETGYLTTPTVNAFASDKARRWYFATRAKAMAADKATGGGGGKRSRPLLTDPDLDASKVKVRFEDGTSPEKVGQGLFGRPLTHEEIVALSVAPAGSEVRVFRKGTGLEFYSSSERHEASRVVSRNDAGELVLDNYSLEIYATGSGLGTKLLARQVETAGSLGISKITTHAVRNADSNGYYTWPRLGYDAELGSRLRAKFSLNAPDKLTQQVVGEKATLSELLATPEGRAFWKEYGATTPMTFDPTPGSRSRQVLAAYIAERFGGGLTWNKFVSARQRRWYFANRSKAEVKKRPSGRSGVVDAPNPKLWNLTTSSVVRWMGKQGWSADEAKKALDQLGVPMSRNTIMGRLSEGRSGKGVADLKPDQVGALTAARSGTPPPVDPKPKPKRRTAKDVSMGKDAIEKAKQAAKEKKSEAAAPTKVQGLKFSRQPNYDDPYDAFGEEVRQKVAKHLNALRTFKANKTRLKATKAIGKKVADFIEQRIAQRPDMVAYANMKTELAQVQADYEKRGQVGGLLWQKRQDLTRRLRKLSEAAMQARREETLKVLQGIRDMGVEPKVAFPDKVPEHLKDYNGSHPANPRERNEIERALETAKTVIPTDWIDPSKEYDLLASRRGYHSSGYPTTTIAVSPGSPGDMERTVLHEFMHAAEQRNLLLGKAQQDYFNERAKGAKPGPLYPGSQENGVPDDFVRPYMGRHYGWSTHYEILTMAAEDILLDNPTDSYGIYEKDRATYEFGLGLLAAH